MITERKDRQTGKETKLKKYQQKRDREAALADKKLVFTAVYAATLDFTHAVKESGLNRRTAINLMAREDFAETVQKAIAQGMSKTAIKMEDILMQLKSVALASPKQLCKGGRMRTPDDLPEDVAQAIAGVTLSVSDKGESYSYKFHSKLKAIDMILRYDSYASGNKLLETQAKIACVELEKKNLEVEKLKMELNTLEAVREDVSDEDFLKQLVQHLPD